MPFSPVEHVTLLGNQKVAGRWLPFARKKFRVLDRGKAHSFYKQFSLKDAVIKLSRVGKIRMIMIQGYGGAVGIYLFGLASGNTHDMLLPGWKRKQLTEGPLVGRSGWTNGVDEAVSWTEDAIYYMGEMVYFFDAAESNFDDSIGLFTNVTSILVCFAIVEKGYIFATLYLEDDAGDSFIHVAKLRVINDAGAPIVDSGEILASSEIDASGIYLSTGAATAVCQSIYGNRGYLFFGKRYHYVVINTVESTASISDEGERFSYTLDQSCDAQKPNIESPTRDLRCEITSTASCTLKVCAIWKLIEQDGEMVESHDIAEISTSESAREYFNKSFTSGDPIPNYTFETSLDVSGTFSVGATSIPLDVALSSTVEFHSGAYTEFDNSTWSFSRDYIVRGASPNWQNMPIFCKQTVTEDGTDVYVLKNSAQIHSLSGWLTLAYEVDQPQNPSDKFAFESAIADFITEDDSFAGTRSSIDPVEFNQLKINGSYFDPQIGSLVGNAPTTFYASASILDAGVISLYTSSGNIFNYISDGTDFPLDNTRYNPVVPHKLN